MLIHPTNNRFRMKKFFLRSVILEFIVEDANDVFPLKLKKRTTILFCFQHQQTTYTFFLKYLYFKLSCGIFVIIVDNNNT